jgi:hypothetical protein
MVCLLGLPYFFIDTCTITLPDSVTTAYDFLNNQSGIFSLSAIIIGIIFFFWQRQNENKEIERKFNDRLRRACKLLIVDIENWRPIKSNESAPFAETVYSLENYRTVVSSRLITYLEKDTILQLTILYHYLELHNKRIFDMNDMVNSVMNSVKDSSDISRERENQLKESYAWVQNVQNLVIYEGEINRRLSIVNDKLNSELGKLKNKE